MPASFLPEDREESAVGLASAGPVEALIKKAVVDYFDYKPKELKPGEEVKRTIAAIITFEVQENGQPKEYSQPYSISNNFTTHTIMADKTGLETGGVPKSSNFSFFLDQAINAGFGKDKMVERNGDIRMFEGWRVELRQVAPPKREGLEKGNKPLPVPVRSIQFPWETKVPSTGAGKGKAASANSTPVPAPAPEPAGDEDGVAAIAVNLLTEMYGKSVNGEGVWKFGTLKTLSAQAMGQYIRLSQAKDTKADYPPDNKLRGKVLALVGSADWMGDGERPWQYDSEAGTLSF